MHHMRQSYRNNFNKRRFISLEFKQSNIKNKLSISQTFSSDFIHSWHAVSSSAATTSANDTLKGYHLLNISNVRFAYFKKSTDKHQIQFTNVCHSIYVYLSIYSPKFKKLIIFIFRENTKFSIKFFYRHKCVLCRWCSQAC